MWETRSKNHYRGDVWLRSLDNWCAVIPSLTLIKRECIDFCGGFRPIPGGFDDYDLWLRIARYYHFDLVGCSVVDREGAALGPAADGGYYLIAFRKPAFVPEAFENIPWSTGKVLTETLRVFEKKGASVRLLDEWQDIDTAEDLAALSDRHPGDISAAPKTLAFLRRGRGLRDRAPWGLPAGAGPGNRGGRADTESCYLAVDVA